MKKFIKAIVIIVSVILILAALLFGVMKLSSAHRSDPAKVREYETDNPYIMEGTDVSAHRIGAGIAPEQTLMAIKNCALNTAFDVDVFEFDLHITKDGVLVLLHDDTLDRTSNSEEVFGETEVRPENKTYEELRQLNMGAKFENEDGIFPYADLETVPDDLKIQRLEDVLDYLESIGDYKYIIEIKNGGELGKKGVDIMYQSLRDRDMVEKVVFGTFNEEVSIYVDTTYTDLARSTSINEVIDFYIAALTNSKTYEPPCCVLQIPFCSPYLDYGINLGTAQVINYAHSHNMALQYWTVNDREDMEYLVSMGADCIMTDYPDVLFEVIND